MALPEYDDSEWPLVVISAPSAPSDDEEFSQHLQIVESFHQRAEPFGMLVDVSHAAPISAGQRRQTGEALARFAKAYPGILVAQAMVVDSALQRGVITAIAWAFRPPYEMRVFGSVDAARTWLRTVLDQRATSAQP